MPSVLIGDGMGFRCRSLIETLAGSVLFELVSCAFRMNEAAMRGRVEHSATGPARFSGVEERGGCDSIHRRTEDMAEWIRRAQTPHLRDHRREADAVKDSAFEVPFGYKLRDRR